MVGSQCASRADTTLARSHQHPKSGVALIAAETDLSAEKAMMVADNYIS
jgi:hypothetical protein